MTGKEAIRKLQKQKAEYLEEWVDFSGVAEAYDMAIKALTQPEIIRCNDCKHRPTGDGFNHRIVFPDDICPCQCSDDEWYSWAPKDDWFCAEAERRTDV